LRSAINNKGVVDKALGFGTHWECVTDVSNPSDPFTCTRTPNSRPTIDALGLSGAMGMHPISAMGARPLNVTGPTTCDYQGGIRLYETVDFGGDCARFTGSGNINVQNVSFPGTSNSVGGAVSSLSSYGSTGYGDLSCSSGQQFNYDSNTRYSNIAGPDRYGTYPSACNDGGQVLYIQ